MEEYLLRLIEKYNDEIRDIEDCIDENHTSERMQIRLAVTLEKNREFINILDEMLNTSF